MKEVLRDILNRNSDRLVNELYIDVVFLAKLVSTGTIQSNHKNEIEAKSTNPEKVGKLIDILLVSQDSCFETFLKHLEKANKDLYDLLYRDSTRTIEPSPRPDPSVNPGRKYFYIRTGLPGSDMVLGTDDNECQPGAKIVLRKPARGTLWYQNEDDEYICSKEGNDLVFDGEGQEFHLNPYTKHNKRKCWVIIDNYIVNHFDHNEVVTLKTANNAGGTEIWRQPRNGDKTQQWYFDYKD